MQNNLLGEGYNARREGILPEGSLSVNVIIFDMLGRERSIRLEAVVLRHSDWGEADRLLWLYTRQAGKMRVVAKGVRKLRSRKAGHLEPFTHVNLLVAKGRDLPIVTQAETIDSYMALREDLTLVGYASYIVELLDRFTYEEGENLALFHLLTTTMERLNAAPDPVFSVRYYEIRFLDQVGFRPQLYQCQHCHAAIQPEDQFFSALLGGLLCSRCGPKLGGAHPISQRAVRILRHLQRSTFEEARRISIDAAAHQELERVMQYYFTYLLERNLNTPAFLWLFQESLTGRQKDPSR